MITASRLNAVEMPAGTTVHATFSAWYESDPAATFSATASILVKASDIAVAIAGGTSRLVGVADAVSLVAYAHDPDDDGSKDYEDGDSKD